MRTVRVGTIVWGAILLVFAVVAFGVAVFDLEEFRAAAVTWTVTGLGGVFVLAAIVALIARAASAPAGAPAAPEPAPAPAAEPEPEPVAKPTASRARAKKDQPVD